MTLHLDPVVANGDEPELSTDTSWLDQPAGDFLDAIPWDGAVPDPDTLDAETFLGLL
jgi:hypothetical protein